MPRDCRMDRPLLTFRKASPFRELADWVEYVALATTL